jgi:hypothetical protein
MADPAWCVMPGTKHYIMWLFEKTGSANAYVVGRWWGCTGQYTIMLLPCVNSILVSYGMPLFG